MTGNEANNMGGGLLAETGSRPVLRRVVFRDNRAAAGGAMAIGFAAIARVENCLAEENLSHGTAGGFEVHDGGELFLRDCLMRGNVGANGGALGIAAGRIEAQACTLLANQAEFGGAACVMSGTLVLFDCTARGNSATTTGGAVMSTSSAAQLSFCVVDSNMAGNGGGALYAHESTVLLSDCLLTRNHAGSSLDSRGGGVCGSSSRLTLERCTLAANYGIPGAAVWTDGIDPLLLERCILALGQGGAAAQGAPEASASAICCDVWGNRDGDWVGLLFGQDGENGNFSEDPEFCGEANPQGPWSIAGSSPCAPPQTGECEQIGACPIGCGPSSMEEATTASNPRLTGNRPLDLFSIPNPFQHVTRVHVTGALEAGRPAAEWQDVAILDAAGRTIRTLRCRLRAGASLTKPDQAAQVWESEVDWNGCDERGQRVPAGVYWIRAGGQADRIGTSARQILFVGE